MRKIHIIFLAVVFIFSSCTKDELPIVETKDVLEKFQKDTLSISEINSRIEMFNKTKGTFRWKDGTYQMLWSAIVNSGNVVTIGYGENVDNFENRRGFNDKQTKEKLKQTILNSEGTNKRVSQEMFLYEDEKINLIDVVVNKRETFEALLEEKNIRYIEPANYNYSPSNYIPSKNGYVLNRSSSGCSLLASKISNVDYTIVAPNAKVPWNFYKHNIPEAWNYSTGLGITIGIIDTGLSAEQKLMGEDFNTGYSSGRTLKKYGVYVDSYFPWSSTTDGPNDQCGHGTSMASVATAPRNTMSLPVGVAYNSNLIIYRAASGVALLDYHAQKGVQKAFVELADNNTVKIISMSMGHVISISRIEDGIKYAYKRGKLIFCAGGTSTNFTSFVGVIFPASMNEVVAVTGVKEGQTMQKCDVCHSGSKIDFTVVMERQGTNNNIPVLGYHTNQEKYVGGSSIATATMAGIAALVWSKNPTWTREQVLNKMKRSTHLYPNKNSDFGYGNIDVLLAVK